MVGIMERFEVIGRGVLEMALQPSNSQPSTGASSQPQASNPPQLRQHASQSPIFSNPQKKYQGPNTTQPPAPFIASSNPAQPLYAPPASQAPEYDIKRDCEILMLVKCFETFWSDPPQAGFPPQLRVEISLSIIVAKLPVQFAIRVGLLLVGILFDEP
jgi:hypothetical protein